MLSLKQAKMIAEKKIVGDFKKCILYDDKYVFLIETEENGNYDPFYFVDANTGKFGGFSFITDADPKRFTELMLHENLLGG